MLGTLLSLGKLRAKPDQAGQAALLLNKLWEVRIVFHTPVLFQHPLVHLLTTLSFIAAIGLTFTRMEDLKRTGVFFVLFNICSIDAALVGFLLLYLTPNANVIIR